MNNNQCYIQEPFLRSQTNAQLLIQFLFFTEHTGSLLFSPQPTHTLSPNFFSPSAICSHTFFTEQYHYWGPQVQCTSNTVLTYQNEGQKSETLTSNSTTNPTFQS